MRSIVIVEKFIEKSIFINEFSFFEAINAVKIRKNTKPSLKNGDQVSKGAPKPPDYLILPFMTNIQNFHPPPLFAGGFKL